MVRDRLAAQVSHPAFGFNLSIYSVLNYFAVFELSNTRSSRISNPPPPVLARLLQLLKFTRKSSRIPHFQPYDECQWLNHSLENQRIQIYWRNIRLHASYVIFKSERTDGRLLHATDVYHGNVTESATTYFDIRYNIPAPQKSFSLTHNLEPRSYEPPRRLHSRASDPVPGCLIPRDIGDRCSRSDRVHKLDVSIERREAQRALVTRSNVGWYRARGEERKRERECV